MKRCLLLITLLAVGFAGCGVLAEPNVTAGGPVYAELRGGTVVAWGYAVNLGTATAKNCILTLTVLAQDARAALEAHELALGDLAPGAKVKYEVALGSFHFGDPIDCRLEFSWD